MLNRAGLTVLLILSCATCLALVIHSVGPHRVPDAKHLIAQHD